MARQVALDLVVVVVAPVVVALDPVVVVVVVAPDPVVVDNCLTQARALARSSSRLPVAGEELAAASHSAAAMPTGEELRLQQPTQQAVTLLP